MRSGVRVGKLRASRAIALGAILATLIVILMLKRGFEERVHDWFVWLGLFGPLALMLWPVLLIRDTGNSPQRDH